MISLNQKFLEVGGPHHFSVIPSPLDFGLGDSGLRGLVLDNKYFVVKVGNQNTQKSQRMSKALSLTTAVFKKSNDQKSIIFMIIFSY